MVRLLAASLCFLRWLVASSLLRLLRWMRCRCCFRSLLLLPELAAALPLPRPGLELTALFPLLRHDLELIVPFPLPRHDLELIVPLPLPRYDLELNARFPHARSDLELIALTPLKRSDPELTAPSFPVVFRSQALAGSVATIGGHALAQPGALSAGCAPLASAFLASLA